MYIFVHNIVIGLVSSIKFMYKLFGVFGYISPRWFYLTLGVHYLGVHILVSCQVVLLLLNCNLSHKISLYFLSNFAV